MSYAEAQTWFAYYRKHGGIGHARTQQLLGQLCVMINRAHGGKAEIEDFLPGLVQEPKAMDDEQVIDMLMGFWNKG